MVQVLLGVGYSIVLLEKVLDMVEVLLGVGIWYRFFLELNKVQVLLGVGYGTGSFMCWI